MKQRAKRRRNNHHRNKDANDNVAANTNDNSNVADGIPANGNGDLVHENGDLVHGNNNDGDLLHGGNPDEDNLLHVDEENPKIQQKAVELKIAQVELKKAQKELDDTYGFQPGKKVADCTCRPTLSVPFSTLLGRS